MRKVEASPKKQNGMGILEAVLAGVLISIFLVIFMGKVLKLSVAVEREAMHQTVINLNSVLNVEALSLVVARDQEGLANWEGGNPMILLDPPPLKYKGSFSQPDALRQSPGSWYFDEGQSMLIYRINNVEQFAGGRAVPERVRFKVVPQFHDTNHDGVKGENERYMGLRLEALDKYQWLKNDGSQGS